MTGCDACIGNDVVTGGRSISHDQQIGGGGILRRRGTPDACHVGVYGSGGIGYRSAGSYRGNDHVVALLLFPIHKALHLVRIVGRAEDEHLGRIAHKTGAGIGVPVENGTGIELVIFHRACSGQQFSRADEVGIDKVYSDLSAFQHCEGVLQRVIADGIKVDGKKPDPAHKTQVFHADDLSGAVISLLIGFFLEDEGKRGGVRRFGNRLLSGNDPMAQLAVFGIQIAGGAGKDAIANFGSQGNGDQLSLHGQLGFADRVCVGIACDAELIKTASAGVHFPQAELIDTITDFKAQIAVVLEQGLIALGGKIDLPALGRQDEAEGKQDRYDQDRFPHEAGLHTWPFDED